MITSFKAWIGSMCSTWYMCACTNQHCWLLNTNALLILRRWQTYSENLTKESRYWQFMPLVWISECDLFPGRAYLEIYMILKQWTIKYLFIWSGINTYMYVHVSEVVKIAMFYLRMFNMYCYLAVLWWCYVYSYSCT